MGAFIRRNALFLIPAVLALCTGIVFLNLYTKEVIHITQNGWAHPMLDPIFKWGTYLGDGWIFVPTILGLSLASYRQALGMLFAAILTLVLVGLLKNVAYPNEQRPIAFFENIAELRLVDGVEQHHSNSFPSGHTTAAFACFGLLSFFSRKNGWRFLCLLAALLVGYSRIYLSQHFLADVVAGGFLGLTIALLSYYLSHILKRPWAQGGILTRRGV